MLPWLHVDSISGYTSNSFFFFLTLYIWAETGRGYKKKLQNYVTYVCPSETLALITHLDKLHGK